jgi:hypothetical protein
MTTTVDPRVERLAIETNPIWVHVNELSRALLMEGARRRLAVVDSEDPVRVACQRLVDEATRRSMEFNRKLMEALGTWDL